MSEDKARGHITPLFDTVKLLLSTFTECQNVTTAQDRIHVPSAGVNKVRLVATLLFTAKAVVPLGSVNKILTNCIRKARSYENMLSLALPPIVVNNWTYKEPNLIMSKERSCCGSKPPPCCTAGSVRSLSEESCGKICFLLSM